jgi:hypothetical protein
MLTSLKPEDTLVMSITSTNRGPAPAAQSDFAWGAEAIGAVINRDEKQTYHLIYSGALDGAVKKINGRHVGSVTKLRALMCGE